MARRSSNQPKFSLDGFYKHHDLVDTLMHISREFGRLGVGEDFLSPYQRSLFRDLQGAIDEEALDDMLEYWNFDIQKLVQRGRGYAPRGTPAKPRIDITMKLSTKGNLKVEWWPSGWDEFNPKRSTDTDFIWFYRIENRHAAFDSRPSNELMFLHGVRQATYSLRHPSIRGHLRDTDQVLLHGCTKAIATLKARLEPHFNVRLLQDVFVAWRESEPDPGSWRSPPPIMLSWELDDPAARQARAERALLDRWEEEHGHSIKALMDAWRSELVKPAGKTGPAPSPHTLALRVTRALKSQGLRATEGTVRRAMDLLREHRPLDTARLERSATEE